MSHTGKQHKAGAFDVRNVIAALIGFYGVVLVIMGLVADSEADRAKTGDVNANLWAGLVMVVVALAFFLWSRLRPVVVDEEAIAEARAGDDDRPAH
jgi:glucose uptake protein GlcU